MDVLAIIRAARVIPVVRRPSAAEAEAARAGMVLAAEVVAAPGALLPREKEYAAKPRHIRSSGD